MALMMIWHALASEGVGNLEFPQQCRPRVRDVSCRGYHAWQKHARIAVPNAVQYSPTWCHTSFNVHDYDFRVVNSYGCRYCRRVCVHVRVLQKILVDG